ncbi:hypothetical protein PspLS_08746 [Pyricularia sp. CBS 133598]|nr:hypothetical protein PspLS_08746 [Pyricularia sp. CBS 133598]
MKAFTVILNLALAASASAALLGGVSAANSLVERQNCVAGGTPCDDKTFCCSYCSEERTCAVTHTCVAKGIIPQGGAHLCCSGKLDPKTWICQ